MLRTLPRAISTLLAITILGAVAHLASAQGLVPVGPLLGPVEVIEVVDGDTIVLASNLGPRIVRLIGIDSPEVSHPEKGREPFGPEASEFLKQRLPPGSQVWVELDLETIDVYGRLLAYVYVGDASGRWSLGDEAATMVNLAVAEAGFARTLPIPPNTLYADLFENAVREAREAGRGMWAPPDTTEPSDGDSEQASLPGGPIVIACILYDAAAPNDEGGEIVYLTIREPLDTRGYYLYDEGSGTVLRLSAGEKEPGTLEIRNPGQGIWNNGGDTVYLMRGGAEVDSWSYQDRAEEGETICRDGSEAP